MENDKNLLRLSTTESRWSRVHPRTSHAKIPYTIQRNIRADETQLKTTLIDTDGRHTAEWISVKLRVCRVRNVDNTQNAQEYSWNHWGSKTSVAFLFIFERKENNKISISPPTHNREHSKKKRVLVSLQVQNLRVTSHIISSTFIPLSVLPK